MNLEVNSVLTLGVFNRRSKTERTVIRKRAISNEGFRVPAGELAFEKSSIKDVDFRGAGFDSFFSVGSVFERCDFRETKMRHGILSHKPPTVYRECRFEGADLLNVNPLTARFERCSFGSLTLWFCYLSEFVECRFTGRLDGCKFSGRPWGPGADLVKPRRVNEFRGNDFRHADLVDTSFVLGIDIDAQLWPESDAYIRLDHPTKRMAEAQREVSTWKDPEAKREALLMLKVYSGEAEGQDVLFLRRDNLSRQQLGDVPPMPQELADKVWDLLLSVPV